MRSLIAVAIVALAGVRVASAQNALTITEVRVDRATHHTAGIQVLISGDANRNAEIRVTVDGPSFVQPRQAPPLFRVLPETVTGRSVPEQFAGSVFDLLPGNTYTLTLQVIDPDGGGGMRTETVTTRPLPRDPLTPRTVPVNNALDLRAALQQAEPGDVIEIADGTYTGTFTLNASGTASQPIVVRGTSRDGTILDGQNCTGCNIVEVYGSHVHWERLTIRNGERALRFLNTTTANAVREVRIEDVVHGISAGANANQTDFTICDNIVHGRLAWPLVYTDDNALHADDQGIRVDGSGHVVCHNDIAGFGDPLINFADGGRAYDFYGNDIHEIYADGTELDRAEGNVRLWGNRFTNQFTAISIQPAYGGPVYVLRNQVVNTADEQIKLKSYGGTIEPSGVLVYHNTFISPERALNLQAGITQHNFVIMNNLFIGPASPAGRNVDWTATIDRGVFDGNGYFPDAGYWFGTVGSARIFATLVEAQAAGIEVNGRVLTTPIFDSGGLAPASYTVMVPRDELRLSASSNASDVARGLPGINARYMGAGPDLGARETGCPEPQYGPRTFGPPSMTNLVDCSLDDTAYPDDGGLVGGDGGTGPGNNGDGDDDGGCCQAPRDARGSLVLLLLVAWRLRRGHSTSRWRQADASTRQ